MWTAHGDKTMRKKANRRTKSERKIARGTCEKANGNTEKANANRRNRAKNRQKSMKNRCWAVLGGQSRFGDALERVEDGSTTPKRRPGIYLGAPRTGQERPGTVQKRPRAGPRTLPDSLGAVSERIDSFEGNQMRSRSDFLSFLCCGAKARMCVSSQFLQCFVGFEQSKQRSHASTEKALKTYENRPFRPPESSSDARKSSSGGPSRAKKRPDRAKHRDFFAFVGSNGLSSAKSRSAKRADRAGGPKAPDVAVNGSPADLELVGPELRHLGRRTSPRPIESRHPLNTTPIQAGRSHSSMWARAGSPLPSWARRSRKLPP